MKIEKRHEAINDTSCNLLTTCNKHFTGGFKACNFCHSLNFRMVVKHIDYTVAAPAVSP